MVRGEVTRLLAALLLLSAAAATSAPRSAVGAGPRRGARAAEVELRPNELPDRLPAAADPASPRSEGNEEVAAAPSSAAALSLTEHAAGVLREVPAVVLGWQISLSRRMPDAVAWAAVSSPLWVILALLVVRSVQRRRSRPLPPALRASRSRARPRATANDRARAEGRVRAPPSVKEKDEAIPPLALAPLQQLLISNDDELPSLHETFVGLGADLDAVSALRRAASEVLTAATWAAAVSDRRLDRLRPLRVRWMRALAAARVERWLSAHPLALSSGLRPHVPFELEAATLPGLTLTEPTGLGAALSPPQEELLDQARSFLAAVYQEAPAAGELHRAARTAGVPQLAAAAGDDRPRESEGSARPEALALATHGVAALGRWGPARAGSSSAWHELREALAEHVATVNTPIPAEGCAAHAAGCIGREPPPGIGMLLCAVAGAAYSSSAVVLRLGKLCGEISKPAWEGALRLGHLAAPLLAERTRGPGMQLGANLRRLIGLELLQDELPRSQELVRKVDRLAAKDPLWGGGTAAAEPPDRAIAGLHLMLVEHQAKQTAAAERRLREILDRLAFPGACGENRQVADARLGYALAGLGPEILRGSGMELMSAGREAWVALQRS